MNQYNTIKSIYKLLNQLEIIVYNYTIVKLGIKIGRIEQTLQVCAKVSKGGYLRFNSDKIVFKTFSIVTVILRKHMFIIKYRYSINQAISSTNFN